MASFLMKQMMMIRTHLPVRDERMEIFVSNGAAESYIANYDCTGAWTFYKRTPSSRRAGKGRHERRVKWEEGKPDTDP